MLASSSSSVEGVSPDPRRAVLLCQVGSIVCALPLEHVSETMRPLPLEVLAGTAPFVAGVSIIRGEPVPIVDLSRLLGNDSDEARTRLVVVRVAERHAALSVGRVIGVRSLDPASLRQMPPLLGGASAEMTAAVGLLDARLLLLLETWRALPDPNSLGLEARGDEA
jgi:purine-binding chemotaxis protein CheW